MKYAISTQSQYTILSFKGDVDLQYSPQAREQILKYLNDSCHLLVDLSSVDYIDSSGIACLVEGFQLSKNKNLDFALVGVSKMAMQVIQLARLDKVFPIYDSVEQRITHQHNNPQ